MNDTPRTESNRMVWDRNNKPGVSAEFALGLERELNEANARIKRLEEAVEAADNYIDALQDHEGVEYTTWVCNVADARNAYRTAKHEAKESK